MLAFPVTVIKKTIIQTCIYCLWLYVEDFPASSLTVIKTSLDECP